jgi:hypothetical protein
MSAEDVRRRLREEPFDLDEETADRLVELGVEVADHVGAADRGVRSPDAVDLKCGHYTERAASVVFSTGRRLYDCPVGCGLQDRKT